MKIKSAIWLIISERIITQVESDSDLIDIFYETICSGPFDPVRLYGKKNIVCTLNSGPKIQGAKQKFIWCLTF